MKVHKVDLMKVERIGKNTIDKYLWKVWQSAKFKHEKEIVKRLFKRRKGDEVK